MLFQNYDFFDYQSGDEDTAPSRIEEEAEVAMDEDSNTGSTSNASTLVNQLILSYSFCRIF